jgi:aminopeptidase N
MRAFLLLALLFPLTTQARQSVNNLERTFAAARRAQIKSVQYDTAFTFLEGKDTFSGVTAIQLELNDLNKPLSVDWLGTKPTAVTVNGKTITDFKTAVGFLEIPATYLKVKTELTFTYTNAYSKEGEGIQKVTDPEDKKEYVYTDFEPYQAHQFFPCFDQPDLKAHFTVTVTAPKEWKAIANELIAEASVKDGLRTTRFKPTPLLSTYLMFVGAGPFEVWTAKADKIPMEIYARKSMAKFVDADQMFDVSRKGLKFYADYFGAEYPFGKFGLVFAPEFGWGGMENPGAIVCNESTLFRGPVPLSRREGRDGLILHEMAHHWFGDFVTMEWWNDLWLNESFATYMATLAQERALGSKMAWEDFAAQKNWGYWQDQLPTTHPIETDVKDVRTARGNFDGITYSKGAAALQQLHFFVGEDAFREGVRGYFKEHAYANAVRADFTDSIAKAGSLNLDKWVHAWLQTAGVNRVSAQAVCNGPLVATSVKQEPSSSGTLSPHRARLGFFSNEKGKLTRLAQADVVYDSATTHVAPEQIACPDFVFPNLGDKDYALFSLDEKSLEAVPAVLGGGLQDPVLRLQTWSMLSQMVRDGKMPALRYVDLAIGGIQSETDEAVLPILLGRRSSIRDIFEQYLSRGDRGRIAPRLQGTIYKRLLSAVPGSSEQMLFFDFYVRLAQTPKALKRITAWLEKKADLPRGIELDQERRWNALMTLARNGAPGAAELVNEEEKRDTSDLAKRMAYTARVAMPTAAAKAVFWKALENWEKIPPSTLRQAAGEFHQPDYQDLSEKYVATYFDRLQHVNWKKSDHLVGVYLGELFPGQLCRKNVLDKSEAELKRAKGLTDLARRHWIESNDELARCIRVGRR